MTAPQLDLYEIAFLAGGRARVVDTALVALVEAGRIRVHSPGQLAVADQVRRHPVDGAVLDAVGTHGHRSVDMIVWRLTGDDRILEIGRRLTAAGLLSRRPAVRSRNGGPPVRTAAGRRLLRELVANPPVFSVHDGGSAVQVALSGQQGMTDDRLRASIFSLPEDRVRWGPEGVRKRITTSRWESGYDSPHAHFGSDAGGGGGGDGGGF